MRSIVAFACASLLLAASASASEGIAAGSRGTIWFTEPMSNRIGRVSASGAIAQFPIPTPNSEPAAIVSGPEGDMWFTEHRANKIGRISPSGSVQEFELPFPVAKSPLEQSLVAHAEQPGPMGIVASGGDVWFTEGGSSFDISSTYGGQVDRMTRSGAVSAFEIPNADSEPGSIVADSDGNLWFTLTTLNGGRIGRVTPSGEITETVLPEEHEPSDLAVGPDGAIWFTETVFGHNQITGNIGRLTPGGALRTFRLPRPTDQPSAIVASRRALWFTEFSGPESSDIATITLAGRVHEYRNVHTPIGIASGPGHTIWFTSGVVFPDHRGEHVGRLSPASGAVRETALRGSG